MERIPRRQLAEHGKRHGWDAFGAVMPDSAIISQVRRRGLEAEICEQGEQAITLGEKSSSLQSDVQAFINPEHSIDPKSQLELMGRVRHAFGQEMPRHSHAQRGELKERLQDRPLERVNPTLLDKLPSRKPNTRRRYWSEIRDVLPPKEWLWTPADSDIAATLLWAPLWEAEGYRVQYNGAIFDPDNKDITPDSPEKPHALKYRTPDGRYVNRQRYIGELLAAGQALKAIDGSIWTFPIMDVSDRPSKSGSTDQLLRIHKATDTITSPESLINIHLLHLIGGKFKNPDVVDLANEVISEIDAHGRHRFVRGIVGVTWANGSDQQFIRQSWWNGINKAGDFQLLKAISGIGNLLPLPNSD